MKSMHSFIGHVPRAIAGWAILSLALALPGTPVCGEEPEKDKPLRRDPFWPIGYHPASIAPAPPSPVDPSRMTVPTAPTEEQWERARRSLVVQGITRSGQITVALVNGRAVRPGDVIEVTAEGFVFRWRVDAIDESGLNVRRLDHAVSPAGTGTKSEQERP